MRLSSDRPTCVPLRPALDQLPSTFVRPEHVLRQAVLLTDPTDPRLSFLTCERVKKEASRERGPVLRDSLKVR